MHSDPYFSGWGTPLIRVFPTNCLIACLDSSIGSNPEELSPMTSVATTVEPVHGRLRRSRAVAALVAVLALVALARILLIDTVWVSSDSMSPTVCTGDLVLVARWNPRAAKVNDIVTFASPADGSFTIKRVVGVAGQRVGIEDGQLVVDGHAVSEPYVDIKTIDGVYYGPVSVPSGTVLVMGDHRELSIDSRSFGPVPVAAIDGRRLATLWSSCPAVPS